MDKVRRIDSIAVPLLHADIDTDQIIPARFMSRTRAEGFAPCLFHDLRFTAGGVTRHFVLDHPTYSGAHILVAGANFGCGSSREQAVYALWDFGFRAVIAPSFGDIFFTNCLQNGLLPIVLSEATASDLGRLLTRTPGMRVVIDLTKQTVSAAGQSHGFDMDADWKRLLREGLDEIDGTVEQMAAINAFEARHRIW